jgi:hypothetical protein
MPATARRYRVSIPPERFMKSPLHRILLTIGVLTLALHGAPLPAQDAADPTVRGALRRLADRHGLWGSLGASRGAARRARGICQKVYGGRAVRRISIRNGSALSEGELGLANTAKYIDHFCDRTRRYR